TGIKVSLGVPIGVSRYWMRPKRQKVVHYWAAEATDAAIRASAFVPNGEISGLEWMSLKKARARLSYPVDVEILDSFSRLVDDGVLRTFPLIALRHAKAVPRSGWDGPDAERPLTERGQRQAAAIAAPLKAFGVRRIVSSDAVRCLQTVAPLERRLGRSARVTAKISQDAWEQGTEDVRAVVGRRVRSRKPAVLCSHGPVLPRILSALALAPGAPHGSYVDSASSLAVAGFSVVHLSATNPGSGFISFETHESKIGSAPTE